MADDIASVGIKVDTDGVTKGVKALDALVDQGPKVEKSMQGVETASAKTGKSLATLGQGGADSGLAKVAKSGKDAADGVGKLADSAAKGAAAVKQVDKASADTARAIAGVGTAVRSLVTSNEAVVASIRGVSTAEAAYIAKLNEEAAHLRAAISERDKYIAQAQGMLAASKDIAAAIGGQVSPLKQVQGASAQASESMLAMVRTGVGAFLGGAVAAGAKAAAAAIYEASAAGERLRTMLNFATGGKSAEEIDYLRRVTNRLGLEFTSTATAYGQFQAAAKGTALEGAKARDIFESIAKASAVMGLSTEQSSGALLALQQMISKGTVQAEELRGQLGERLPGAFQIAAKAMGVTTAELGKMLEQGLVVADDFLPKFARAINENIGGAAESAADRLDAATNRFSNAWERLKQTIGDAGATKLIQNEIKAVTDDVTVFGETMDAVGKKGGGFFTQIAAASGIEAGRAAFAILNGGANLLNGTINALTGNAFNLSTNMAILPDVFKTSAQQAAALAQDLTRAEAEFARLKEQGGTEGGNVYWRSELFQLGQYINKLKAAQAEKARLAVGNTDSQAGDTFRTNAAAAEAKRLDGVRTAMQKVQQGLADVKDAFYKDLNALYAGYKDGLITLKDYQTQVAKLINDSGGGKERAAAIKETNKALTEQGKLLAEAAGLTADFSADWAGLNKAYKQGKLSIEQLEKAQAKLLEKQPAIKAARQEEIALSKALYAQELQTADEIAAGYVAESKAREQGRLAVYEYGRAIDEANAFTNFELGLMGRTQQARDIAIAQYRIELELKKQIDAIDKNAGFDEAQRIEERAKAREAAARAMAGAETRAYVDEWKRASEKISDSLTDALLRGFESGKGFLRNLRDTVVNMFKTMVLRPIIQAVISPVSSAIASTAGSLLPGLASAGGAGGSALGTAAGLGSIGSLSSAFSGGWQLAGAGLGTDAFSGGWTDLMEGSGTVAGNLGKMLGAGTQMLGTAVGYISAIKSIADGKYATAIGTGIGTYIGGPIGAIIGNAIGSAADKLFSGGAGTPHMGADYVSTGNSGYRPGANEVGIYSAGASVNENRSQAVEDALKVLTGTGAGLLNALATSFGQAANYAVGGYYAADGHDPAQGNTRITAGGQTISSTATRYGVSDAQQGMEAFTAELAGQVRQALNSMDIPAWAKSQLSALSSSAGFDELANAVQMIGNTKVALQQLGAVMPQLSGLTDSAIDGLLKAMGGIDSLRVSASSYYDAFYSDAEKSAAATASLTSELSALGLSMPATREAYRALVEVQDLSTDSGRAAYAQLLKLSPAFAALVPVTAELAAVVDDSASAIAEAAAKMAEAGRKVLADLASSQADLQVELLRAQGRVQDAAALERQHALSRLTEGLSATDAAAATAAYDFNAALRVQIDTLNAATLAAQQAADAEAQRLANVAQQREGLQAQLDQLMGNTAALRERELAGLDETNRALQLRIYTQQDLLAAEQQTAQAAQVEAQRVAAIAQQRASLEDRLIQAMGDTAEIRRRELAAQDESNRSILERIYLLQDEKAATESESARLRAVASERDGLMGRLFQAEGDTAALRARDLAGLDESNRALLERIFAIEDEKAAQQAAAAAAQEAAQKAAQAAEQLRSAWQSVTDSIFDEVKRIRDLMAGTSAQSLASAQAQFAITTAQARSGDQEAAKLLPGLSQTLLQLAEAGASSLLDLQRIRAQVAASLEQTGNGLVNRFGLSLPKFAVGTNYVPRDMAAIVHEGEAIVPRAYNPAASGGGSGRGGAEVVAEMRAMREEAKAQSLAMVRMQAEMARVLKKWDGGGLPEERLTA